MGSTAARRPRKDVVRNHNRILEVAAEIFARDGIEASLDEIAAAAGLGVGTVYRHFPTKDALLDELFEGTLNELVATSEAALADPDPWVGFVRYMEAVVEAFVANRALEDVLREATRGQARLTASRERLSAPVGELVERAKAAGALPPDFKPVDMAIIHAMLMAVMRGTEESGPNTWGSYFTTDAWRRYLELILDGLSSQARRSG